MVHLTVVVPLGNTAPANEVLLLKLLVIVAPGQLSEYPAGSNSVPATT